jgi:hypothetical protein
VFKNRVIAERSWNEGEDADNIWKEMATHAYSEGSYRSVWSN